MTTVNKSLPRSFGYRSDQSEICRLFDLAQHHAQFDFEVEASPAAASGKAQTEFPVQKKICPWVSFILKAKPAPSTPTSKAHLRRKEGHGQRLIHSAGKSSPQSKSTNPSGRSSVLTSPTDLTVRDSGPEPKGGVIHAPGQCQPPQQASSSRLVGPSVRLLHANSANLMWVCHVSCLH